METTAESPSPGKFADDLFWRVTDVSTSSYLRVYARIVFISLTGFCRCNFQCTFRELTLSDIYRMELCFLVCYNYANCFHLQAFLRFTCGAVGVRKVHQKLGDSVLSMTFCYCEENATGRTVAHVNRAGCAGCR